MAIILRCPEYKKLLDDGKDFGTSEYKHIFACSGGNINVTFDKLNLLLKNNTDINSTDPDTDDISNMKLHHNFKTISGIKNFRRKHGK